MTLNEKVKSYRLASHMTLADVAKKQRCSAAAISRYERGQRRIPTEYLVFWVRMGAAKPEDILLDNAGEGSCSSPRRTSAKPIRPQCETTSSIPVLELVIDAMSKQIPMRVVGDPYYEQCGCPKCKQQVCGNYCAWCGQKLKWEDEDDEV